jgi:uncharacterized protein YfaS (alpha-2-macroglobulin family)
MKPRSRRPSPLRRRALTATCLAAVATALACWHGAAKSPDLAPPRTLGPRGESKAATPKKEFGVVFARPQGPVVDPSEISIVWNRPMRPLELAGEESAAPATVVDRTGAAVAGAWRWMGTSAVVFAPTKALPKATEFVVTVPRGTKALDGTPLAEEYSFSFSTAPPKLLSLEATTPSDHLTPKATFELRFNQPVELAEVERATHIHVADSKEDWAYHAAWVKPTLRTLVKVTPTTPFPLDSKVDVVVDGSLRGVEGPLTLGEGKTLTLSTYGPLMVRGLDCSRDTPNKKCEGGDSEPRIELSNNVRCKDMQAHVRVTPAVPLHWVCGDYPSTVWGIPGLFGHARRYTITITPGLKDVYGQTLAATSTHEMETDDRWPSVDLGVAGTIFEAGRPGDASGAHAPPLRVVPVSAVNTDSYDLLAAPVDEAGVARYLTMSTKGFEAARNLVQGGIEEVKPKGAKNASSVKNVSLDTVVGKTGRGAAFVGYSAPSHHPWRSDTDVRLLAVTDLAISAKMSRFGGVVWVTRLSDGQPVAGATVAVRDESGIEEFSTKADDSGIAIIPADKYNPILGDGSVDPNAVLFARDGTDWTFKEVRDQISEWRLPISSDTSGRLYPIGMLFTERGVYRPGETVRVKGLFRQPRAKGTDTPSGRDATIEARDGSGEKIFDGTVKLDAFGGFAVDVPVPPTAHLGTGEVVAKVDSDVQDKPTGTASVSMMLAEYRPAEFKVRVDPNKPSFTRGDVASFETQGDYLFGAPMGGGSVHFTATRARSFFSPPGAEGLVLDDDSYAYDLPSSSMRAGQIQSGNGALSAKGSYAAKVPLAMPAQRGAETVSFEAEVMDISRQTIAGRASVLVHPGEFYVALRPPADYFAKTGDTLRPEVMAIEPSGAKREGVKVHLDLVRRTWRSALEAEGETSRHYQSTTVDKILSSCDVVTAAGGPAACDLPVTEAGYLIVHATAKDKRRNPLGGSTSLYAFGESFDVGWRMSDTTTVELVADKKAYEVGDKATILVKNPFREATALITVERAGVYKQERRALAGPMPTITVPITDDLRPNAYVSVQIVEGRSDAAPLPPEAGHDLTPDKGVPVYRIGYATLTVNPEARRLKVSIAPAKKSLGPGDMASADIRVLDREGHPVTSEVTFYAVDEGVLMLTDYRTPDPIPTFTAPRPLAVFTLESREDLAHLLINPNGGSGGDKGHDGGGGGPTSVRSDFRATAYFEPSLTTGKDGKAHVEFKLPDSLTSYRLMAVAAGEDDRFGFGEAELVTSRPLMARPELPRFLRAGDTVDAGIVVTSKGMPAGNVEVSVAASGVTVSGDAKRTLAIPASGSMEARWPIAAPRSGKAELTFSVKGLGDGAPHDEVKVTRDVEIPLVPEAVALYGETTGVASERLGDLADMRDDTGGLDIRLASTALIGLEDGADALIHYPYGCTEQLTSRLVPLIPLAALAKDYHVDLPPNLDAVIDETIAKILKNQHSDGSFGWWIDSRTSDPWLTAYALWGLSVAKADGHAVPDDAIDRATRSVHGSLARWDTNEWTRPEAAFALDVLATVGSPDPGYMDRIYEKQDKLPLFARAFLAHALVVSRGKEAAPQIAELDRDLESHLRVSAVGATVVENVGSEYSALMDSEAWQTAIVLRTLVAEDPGHPLAGRIAKGLMALRKDGSWGTTRDNAWALLALDDYRHAQEKDVPDFDGKVSLGPAEIFTAPFRGRSTRAASSSVPADKLFSGQGSGAALTFDVAGTGKLYYEARLRYSKKELPKDELDRGFTVRKLVRSLRPEQLQDALGTLPLATTTAATATDLVLVDLLVVTPDPREQVVVDDPLPAGLEAVNAALATTARSLDVTDAGGEGDSSNGDSDDDSRANGLAYNQVWYHREIKDDRVLTFVEHMPAGMYHFRYLARATTIGNFVVPPTRAECMYEPEIFGRTAGSTFEVRAP